MKLNHLNLIVNDLDEAQRLFIELFDFTFERSVGGALAVLNDRDGFALVLADAARFGDKSPTYPSGFHVGFIVERDEDVDVMHARTVATGLNPAHQPRRQHGSYGFYFIALDGILFEVASSST